jgi:hypothetical protein
LIIPSCYLLFKKKIEEEIGNGKFDLKENIEELQLKIENISFNSILDESPSLMYYKY